MIQAEETKSWGDRLLSDIDNFLLQSLWMGDEIDSGSYKTVYLSGVLGKHNRVISIWDPSYLSKSEDQLKLHEIPCSFFIAKNRFEEATVDVSKFCSLGSLASWLEKQDIEAIRENFSTIAFTFLSGVNTLHKNHIAHSDLKPENIFLFTGKDGKVYSRVGDLDGVRVMDENGMGIAGIFTGQYSKYPILMEERKKPVRLDVNDIHACLIILLNLYYQNDNPTFEVLNHLKEAYAAWYDCGKWDPSYAKTLSNVLNQLTKVINQDIRNIPDQNIKKFFIEIARECMRSRSLEPALASNLFDSIRGEILELDEREIRKQEEHDAYFHKNSDAPFSVMIIYALPRSVQILLAQAKELIETTEKQQQGETSDEPNLRAEINDWISKAKHSIEKFPDDPDYLKLLNGLSDELEKGCSEVELMSSNSQNFTNL